MSRMPEDGSPAHGAALGARGSSLSAQRTNARLGTSPKSATPVLAIKPTGRPRTASRQRRKSLRAVRAPEQPAPENVENLATYRALTREYQVSLTFSGQAAAVISELMKDLGVDTPNEVVKQAIPLLLSARGKEILLRDPATGAIEIVKPEVPTWTSIAIPVSP